MMYLVTVTDKHSVNNCTNKQSDLGDGSLAFAEQMEEQVDREWLQVTNSKNKVCYILLLQ